MTTLLTPVGRFVGGSLTKPQTTDAEGKPLVYKTGADVGKPRVSYFVAIAIPKGPEPTWAHTPWGAEIWRTGHEAFPQGQADHPAFAWKIEDGDSQIPNKKGNKPCDREGYRGCWILKFSSSFAPKTFNRDGSQDIDPEGIKPGYYIQISGSVEGNGSSQQPGVYLNHNMIALAAYGEEIAFGPDASEAGFGASPLPAGASAVPLGGFTPPPVAPGAGGYVAPVAAAVPPPVIPAPMPAAPPAPAFLQVPPPVAPVHVMLPAANGITYEAYRAANWTDAQLVQMGMMQA
jgi:hypothetical protein